jgi:hypothetical protein
MQESLEFSPHVGCPNNCKLCPQKQLMNAYKGNKVLGFADFVKMLSTVPRSIKIIFAGVSEPFLNPLFVKMCGYLDYKGYSFTIDSTLLNATPRDIDELAEMQHLTDFVYHLPDAVNFRMPVNYPMETLKELMNMIPSAKPVSLHKGFLSNLREVDASLKKYRGFGYCEALHTPHFMVLPNGNVQLCCMDFRLEHTIGNLLEENYSEIRQRLTGTFKLCHTCSVYHSLLRHVYSEVRKKIIRLEADV